MLLMEISSSTSVSLFWIVLATLVAPAIGHATRRVLPEVVLLLGLGVLIGPSGLQLAGATNLEMLKQLGLGLLFLSAGYEIDPNDLVGRRTRSAALTWLVCLVIGFGVGILIVPGHRWLNAAALAIALSSTALGTLMPILREQGVLDRPLGRAFLAQGTVGELGPVAAMAILLSSNSPWVGALVLIGFGVLTAGLALGTRHRMRRAAHRVNDQLRHLSEAERQDVYQRVIDWFIRTGEHRLTQGTMRTIMLLLTGLMALATLFDVDVALGAFMAGLCLRLIVGDHTGPLEERISVLGNSFFIPVFFVMSGMGIALDAVRSSPLTVVAAFFAVLVTRGLPVWLAERFTSTGSGVAAGAERAKLALYSSAGLPIIVAVTEVAVSQELMPASLGSCLVAAGALTVLVFPLAARGLDRAARRTRSGRTGRALPGPGAAGTTERPDAGAAVGRPAGWGRAAAAGGGRRAPS